MTLPTSITAGDPGHIADHEEIHQIVDDVYPTGGAAPADASLFRMMRYARQAATPSAGRLGSLFQDSDVPAAAPGSLGRLLIDDGTAYRELWKLIGDAALSLLAATANFTSWKVPAVRATQDVPGTVSSGAFQTINWDSVTSGTAFDNDSIWNGSSRLVATRDGFWSGGLYVNLEIGGLSTDQIAARVLKGGSTTLARQDIYNSGGEEHICIPFMAELEVGEYVEAQVYQDTGSGKDLQPTSAFWMQFVSDE